MRQIPGLFRWAIFLSPLAGGFLVFACSSSPQPTVVADASVDGATEGGTADAGGNDSSSDGPSSANETGPDGASWDGPACAADAGITVSAEIPVPGPSDAGPAQTAPVAAFDGTDYLLVWEEGLSNGSSETIKAIRISSTGSVLDSTPIAVNSVNSSLGGAGFDGTNLVVAWAAQGDTYITRITPAGTVLDPNGVQVATSATSPNIACTQGRCLVSWAVQPSIDDLGVARVDSQGNVLDSQPLLITPTTVGGGADAGGAFIRFPQVDSDGTNFFLVWSLVLENNNVSLQWASVSSATGALLGAGYVPAAGPNVLTPSALAFGASNHFVEWGQADDGGVVLQYGEHLSGAGAGLGSGVFPLLVVSQGHQYPEAAIFDGLDFVSTWSQGFPGGGTLTGTRTSPLGASYPTPFTVFDESDAGYVDLFNPRMATDGRGTSLVAYYTCGGIGGTCVVHARLLQESCR